jgi:hypothetical protein
VVVAGRCSNTLATQCETTELVPDDEFDSVDVDVVVVVGECGTAGWWSAGVE